MRVIYLPALAALAGCATLPAPSLQPGAADIRLSVAAAEAGLRQLVLDVQDPAATADYTGVAAALDVARVTVATQALLGAEDFTPALAAERALLGVTLKVCADGVAAMQAAPQDAGTFARGAFGFTCLVPLSLFAVR
ncbi:hypothetical protein FJQ54_13595 [Sandaracinobacter neustonicus]|uniref:Lipoprotein n=1 Tax=Sandaracinobacter neustonicus TaxID=1715348 RepID=A0A501XG46_9SPHN|nr:hypothetical protein [Sandaracinobacter neustonicus]TPE59510.1 hypothetical protein FJQ54_13595 [Sandaracinobacter neustonicus]